MSLNPVPLSQKVLSSSELDELYDYANRLSAGYDKYANRKGRLLQILINAYVSACKDAKELVDSIEELKNKRSQNE